MRRAVKWFLLLGALAVILVVASVWGYRFYMERMYPIQYQEWVEQYSQEYGVPKSLVYSVIRSESSFRPDAESSVGARGLMQITEQTFQWAQMRHNLTEETFDDLFDPQINIRYGTYILSLLLEEFGSVQNALCAYHAGWGVTQEWLADPEITPDGTTITNIPYGDTRAYVRKVLDTQEIYRELYGIEDENPGLQAN